MSQWLTIAGMGEDGWDGLSPKAQLAIRNAVVLVGSTRLLGFTPQSAAERHEWPQPFSAVIDRIKPLRGRKTVVLATGDPLNYGVARKLMEFIPFAEMEIIPHVSAFSLAAARVGWPLPDCDTLTLHGRDAAHIEPFIQPDVRLLVLTADRTTIPEVARRLTARGFGKSDITVLENMGGERERKSSFIADAIPSTSFSDLNTLAIHCIASPGARVLSRLAGLPDEAFVHDGQLTKREVRAATLAALGPAPDQLLWDVGAGCGSVSIEWMRAARGCMSIAFEHDAERLGMIATNMDALGAPRLTVVPGEVPATYAGQPSPDAIFIGGAIWLPGVFDGAWSALRPGGTLVANAVTLEGETHLYDLHEKFGGDIVRMEVSSLTSVGRLRALRPRMAVTQWRTRKPW
ncbi:MAG: precorrin-6y C5,15-methyltransferase (decarboxylating) subunit CbiE [Aestuariivirga sp.]|uniref:precorrin-6y C5,15-methyltransferase (decarboxylating) subunit CbiE n=1 Tax=Aestuariivirga sp. TaxID=2650926 RepID=UPI0025C22735|nr:precorrin-6y C5,15-methyltransferase (decarboxylating) subunit CbiE [Aestuariivirga sp.]MCA3560290.1 precorrin-6y C5,15-methyltransferase (decarboxylating) subunit CbiE [Aestuariivirga sp.]